MPSWRAAGATRAAAAVLVVLLAGLLAACGAASPASPHGERGSSAAPALADVTPAADPKAYDGPAHVELGKDAIDPVTEDPKQKLPVTVTDTQGTEVTVTDTDRILALDIYGTLSRTVFELGLGDQVVGRDVSSGFEEISELPLVTQNGHELNAESILALDPTVILTDTSLGPWDVILQMRDAGVPVVVVDSARDVDTLAPLTQQVADALGVPEAGRQLGARMERETADVRAAIAEIAPTAVQDQLRIVFLYVRGQSGTYYMFGEGSGADSLIEALGGYDVSEEIGWKGSRPVNDEGIIAAQPDLILMMTKGLESVGGVDGLLERLPALAQTPAGQNQRIVDMDDSQILSFGPRTADVLNALAVAIYAPEAL